MLVSSLHAPLHVPVLFQFMSETKEHWCVGTDDTGDLTTWENFAKFKMEVEEELEEVLLVSCHFKPKCVWYVSFQVTADGSMDCSKVPEKQEAMIAHLLFCQTVAAFLLLRQGGNFVLKTFTTLEHRTVCLMYMLACCFKEVSCDLGTLWLWSFPPLPLSLFPSSPSPWFPFSPLPSFCLSPLLPSILLQVNVFKPATSKSGNSEQYVVCMDYRGQGLLTQRHLEKLKQAFSEQ